MPTPVVPPGPAPATPPNQIGYKRFRFTPEQIAMMEDEIHRGAMLRTFRRCSLAPGGSSNPNDLPPGRDIPVAPEDANLISSLFGEPEPLPREITPDMLDEAYDSDCDDGGLEYRALLQERDRRGFAMNDREHMPLFDFDFPVAVRPSSTPGKYHVYLNKAISWVEYRNILNAFADAGLLEEGWVDSARRQGQAFLRCPGVDKPAAQIERENTPEAPREETFQGHRRQEALPVQPLRSGVVLPPPPTTPPNRPGSRRSSTILPDAVERLRAVLRQRSSNRPVITVSDVSPILTRDDGLDNTVYTTNTTNPDL